MRNYLNKGHSFRKAGSLEKAIKIYAKAANQPTDKGRDAGYYMLAFTYVLLAHRMRNTLCHLGADLRRGSKNPFEEANRCLAHIENKNFDPKQLGLPVLASYEVDEIRMHVPDTTSH
jgi:hypothetical protein